MIDEVVADKRVIIIDKHSEDTDTYKIDKIIAVVMEDSYVYYKAESSMKEEHNISIILLGCHEFIRLASWLKIIIITTNSGDTK